LSNEYPTCMLCGKQLFDDDEACPGCYSRYANDIKHGKPPKGIKPRFFTMGHFIRFGVLNQANRVLNDPECHITMTKDALEKVLHVHSQEELTQEIVQQRFEEELDNLRCHQEAIESYERPNKKEEERRKKFSLY